MEKNTGISASGHILVEKYKLRPGQTEAELLYEIEHGLVGPERSPLTNIWLTTGWTEILKLITGASTSHFDNTNALIGVGNSDTAANASQTDLLGVSTAYKGMEANYPSTPASGTVQLKAKFLTSEANFAWQEVVVKNSVSSVCWNRAVSSLGTKDSSEIWYVTVTLGKAA